NDQPVDDLTRLPLRGAFVGTAAAAIAAARASGGECALLVIDIDQFRTVNDTHGHLKGDAVLVLVGELLRRTLRSGDIAARWGGDEFVALLPGAPIPRARDVAQRLAAAIRGHTGLVDARAEPIGVTVSIGVASFPSHGNDPEALFAAADRAMYQVKRRGRDGVAVAGGAQGAVMMPALDRFVGRSDEVRGLVRLLDEATSGRPRTVAVLGEAGVGKSTLLRQLEPEIRLRGGSMVIGRSLDAALIHAPYAPWIEIVESLERLRVQGRDAHPANRGATGEAPRSPLAAPSGTPTAASLAALFAEGGAAPPGVRLPVTPSRSRTISGAGARWPELARIVPALAPNGTPDPVPTGSKFALLAELAAYIADAAAQRPLVIVLDDLQGADAASWDALEHVVTQLESEPVLLCLTLRMEDVTPEVHERMRRLVQNRRLHEQALARLTRDELRRWIETAFHGQEMGREFLAFLYRQTEGNPLLVVQTLRTLVDEGDVWWDRDEWHWRPVSELRLPNGVLDLMGRRLARLGDAHRDILAVAAVIGREFDLGVLQDASGMVLQSLHDAIEAGVRASVIQPAHGRGSERYVFVHTLLVEALTRAVEPRRMQGMHERVAHALRNRMPDAVAEIAMHFDRADDAVQAHAFALAASERARRVYAHGESEEFLRIAERHAPDPAAVAAVRVAMAGIAELRGNYAEAEESCALALDWFAARADLRQTLRLRRMRERLRALLGEPARQTLLACESLVFDASELGADDERVALLGMLAATHLRLGDRHAAIATARDAVSLASRLGDDALLAEVLVRLGVALDGDDAGEAEVSYRRALGLYEQLQDVRGQARCWDRIGVVAAQRGEWAEARTSLRRAIDLGRTAATPDEWGLAALDLGVVARRTGDLEQARELFGEALALFAAVQNGERQLLALYHLAHLDRERGDLAAAADLYDVAASLAERVGQHDVEVGAVAGAGLCRLRLGDHARAQQCMEKAESLATAHDGWFPGRELHDALAVELLAADGDHGAMAARLGDAWQRARASDAWAAGWLLTEVTPTVQRIAPALLEGLLAERDDALDAMRTRGTA
ncbi:MAG TPA: diguanylate cyclase, partial [Gemmatimonadaceae bacterium]|nr:diguanylate cyclase [Gemmatimonadaceae bacterium]